MTDYRELEFNDMRVRQRPDGYINATDMCKAGGKLFGSWYCLNSAKEYISELSGELNISIEKLVQIKRGGKSKQQGTWIHPQIATYLATWISPKFAVKVSGWIEEWKALNTNNKTKYTLALNSLVGSKSNQKEKEIQIRLQKELNAEAEVETPAGSIDLVSKDKIIEIKEISKWKHAVGQILCYSHYVAKSKEIYLFGESDIDRQIIMDNCAQLCISVVFL
jgi:hypothetical protein